VNLEAKKATVLVVEDDDAARRLVAAVIRNLGAQVVEVADGESALAAVKDGKFDLICLDICLPERSGFRVCEELRRRPVTKDIPILILSARTGLEDHARALELGVEVFMEKPFKASDLRNQVRHLISRRGMELSA